MDNDISHAVEERLSAIEARLDALEGDGTGDGDGEEENGDEEVSTLPEDTVGTVPATSSYRGRRRSASDVVSEVSTEGSE